MLYLDVVVVVPAAALLLVLLRWRDGGWLVRAIAIAGLLLAPIGAYASFVEPQRLVVERADVPLDGARAGERAVTIAVLADLQFEHLGEHERKAVARALELRPDVILLAGDYQQGSRASFERELPGLRRLMARLHAPGGVYAVQGDQEPSIEATRRIFAGTGVRLLVNESVTTRVADRTLTIAGLELNWRTPAARADDRASCSARRAPTTSASCSTHRPDPILRLAPDSRVDLLVAGHTHGGQIQLPSTDRSEPPAPSPARSAAAASTRSTAAASTSAAASASNAARRRSSASTPRPRSRCWSCGDALSGGRPRRDAEARRRRR